MMTVQQKSRFDVVELTNGGECAIVSFRDEDHTLANALRYIVVKNKEVKFCGYSIPHPNDNICLMQIQMVSGLQALDALEKGLRDLMDSCQHIKQLFNKRFDEFVKKEDKQ